MCTSLPEQGQAQRESSSSCRVLFLGRGSVQGDDVRDDAEDGGCVAAAPAGHGVAVALPQAVGGHEAAVAAAAAPVGGGQWGAASRAQLIQEHLWGRVGEKAGRVQEVLVIRDGSGGGGQKGGVVMLIVSW